VPTFATDTSYYQAPVDDTYPHPWVIFRGCDGTFVDPLFSKNYAWACKAAAAGKIVGFTVYAVYRPGIDIVQQIKGIVGVPDKHLTVMIDVETWGGQIGGNRSSEITRMAEGFASWLGSRKRVLAYANRGDFAVLFPSRPSWLKLVVAGYSSVQPVFPNMIGWQYSDGEARWSVPAGYPRSTPPFGACDHNVFPFHTPQQLAVALGVAEAAHDTETSNPTPLEGDDDMARFVRSTKTNRIYLVVPAHRPQEIHGGMANVRKFAALYGISPTVTPVPHDTIELAALRFGGNK
jgi:hypothetical protein